MSLVPACRAARPYPSGRRLLAAVLLLAALAACAPSTTAAEPDLDERVLDGKYPRGDYSVYLGWHDPEDWQFDEHGSWALPVGFKVRFRWLDWLRVEGDVSYFRRSNEPDVLVSLYRAPNFDGLVLGGSLQAMLRRSGVFRPYVGAGPVVASLGNDFLVFRPEVRDADPQNPDQFALATWSQLDVGVQALAGVDFYLGHRISPFLEYRHLAGSLDLDDGDVTIGAFAFDPAELNTVPDSPADDGRPHSAHYDWSGPVVVGGLKVRF
jgi:opacity protein-like surface antigen